jgi:hypothetical protein
MSELDMVTTVIGIVPPSAPLWAVFAAEESGDEIWTERVHLWAHTRTALPADRAAEETFIDREVPAPRVEVQSMVLCEGDLVLATETEWLFLGYSEKESASVEDWRDAIKNARRLFKRKIGGEID